MDEQGREMVPDHPRAGEEGVAAPGEVIAAWLPCIGCGYDLKALALSGRCPECGRACRDSLKSMAAAEAADIAAVTTGMRWMAAAGVVFPMAFVVMVAIDVRRELSSWVLTQLAVIGVGVVGPMMAQIGLIMLTGRVRTVPNIARLGPERALDRNSLARGAGLVYVLCSLSATILVILRIQGVAVWTETSPWWWATWASLVGTGLAWTVRNVLAARRCRMMAALSNAPGMRRTFGSLAMVSMGGAAVVACYGAAAVFVLAYREWLFNYGPGADRTTQAAIIWTVQTVGTILNGAALGWLCLWPIMLERLARHGRTVEARVRAGSGVLVRGGASDKG